MSFFSLTILFGHALLAQALPGQKAAGRDDQAGMVMVPAGRAPRNAQAEVLLEVPGSPVRGASARKITRLQGNTLKALRMG